MLSWLRKNTKAIMIVVAVLFLGSMFYGLGYQGMKGEEGPSKIIAKINGREIDPLRYQEILNRVVQSMGRSVSPSDMAFIDSLALNQAVDFTLMLGEAKKKVKVSGAETDGAIQGIMNQQKIPSKRELEQALKRMGLSMGKFRDLIKDDILAQKFQAKFAGEIRITPDDLREVSASHILVSSEAQARDLLQKINQGGNFAGLARQYSIDQGSAAKGGDLGYFSTGAMVEPFEKAAFALKPGEVSGIVQSPFGYHIIKVADSRLRKVDDNTALREKQEKSFRRWFSEIKSKAKIEVINPILKGHDYRFRGQIQPAINEYLKAAKQMPANPAIHIFLGDTYMSIGRKDMALAEYENAVKMEGGNPDLYLILGSAYEKAGEKTLAADQFKRASLIAGDNKALHERLLKMFKGMKRSADVAREKTELKRIEKKEKFEKGLQLK